MGPPARTGQSGASGARGSHGLGAGVWQSVALVALVFAAFAPALAAGYVWDDNAVTQNPAIRDPGGLWRIWTQPALGGEEHYWPLVYSVFWLGHKLWGLNPAGFHLLNVALHAASACLVLACLRRIGWARRQPGWGQLSGPFTRRASNRWRG